MDIRSPTYVIFQYYAFYPPFYSTFPQFPFRILPSTFHSSACYHSGLLAALLIMWQSSKQKALPEPATFSHNIVLLTMTTLWLCSVDSFRCLNNGTYVSLFWWKKFEVRLLNVLQCSVCCHAMLNINFYLLLLWCSIIVRIGSAVIKSHNFKSYDFTQ